ncbi:hypothetical protein, partial [Mariniphaga sp.]|uniref:hypothetical protein n=1 Tax=Mariniphaga sp. TaxID=1954475 RepID=UPI0035647D53
MKKLFLIAACIICAGGIALVTGVHFLRNVHGRKMNNESGTVYIKETLNGYEIIRNGKPFYINGAAGFSHFKELAETGGNTIRVYDTTNIAHILDVAYANNLAVIVDIPIPPYNKKYNLYLNKDHNKLLK